MDGVSADERKSATENISDIVDSTGQLGEHIVEAGVEAVQRSKEIVGAVGGSVVESMQAKLKDRDNVMMVRVDGVSLKSIDSLVDADIVKSRSEAAAYLIMAGIKARRPLFDRIALKVDEIRKAKIELHAMLTETDVDGSFEDENFTPEHQIQD